MVSVSGGGSVTNELIVECVEKSYNCRPGALLNTPSLLVIDSATCHKEEQLTRKSPKTKVSDS